uniref:peptidylprolyl isomerase n=1 Tax=Scylla olivacea TaxID=85551 RepID=A0A0P4WFD0_SCYOL
MAGEQAAVDITPNKDGGVLKEVLQSGEGEEGPLHGDKVYVHYVGTLLEDGSKFDSSRDRGERFSFTLGKGEVIKAWDLGVASMKKGELARLTCRSDYAYGEQGSPPKIPANATLVFEVELFEWHGEDLSQKKDGGIIRRNVTAGEGYQTPNDGALLNVHIIGRVNGTVFDERDVKFPLGEGSEYNIPEGLETALEKFKKGEKSVIKLSPKYAFGAEGNPSLGVPPGASVEYEAELCSFEKAKESWEMDQAEKIEQAKTCKERGTQFLKSEKYKLAVKQYKKIIDLLEYDAGTDSTSSEDGSDSGEEASSEANTKGLDDEKKAESQSVLLAGHLNLSMVYLKLKDYSSVLEHATKAVGMDSNSVKAYFRRGQAHLSMGDPILAQKDFQSCLNLEQNNKAAKQQLMICAQKIKADKLREKQIYGGMFEKFAKQDMEKKKAEAKVDTTEEKKSEEKPEGVC